MIFSLKIVKAINPLLSGVYEFIALTIFEENLNLSEKFSSSRQSLYQKNFSKISERRQIIKLLFFRFQHPHLIGSPFIGLIEFEMGEDGS